MIRCWLRQIKSGDIVLTGTAQVKEHATCAKRAYFLTDVGGMAVELGVKLTPNLDIGFEFVGEEALVV